MVKYGECRTANSQTTAVNTSWIFMLIFSILDMTAKMWAGYHRHQIYRRRLCGAHNLEGRQSAAGRVLVLTSTWHGRTDRSSSLNHSDRNSFKQPHNRVSSKKQDRFFSHDETPEICNRFKKISCRKNIKAIFCCVTRNASDVQINSVAGSRKLRALELKE